MISELRVATYNLGNGTLTQTIFNDVLQEKIEQHKDDMACEKMKREKYKALMQSAQT